MIDIAVYVHFPWCLRKCPYCDFATSPRQRSEIAHRAYADAVLRELAFRAPPLAEQRLISVFFGGGTPSLWEPYELGRVLSAIRAAFASEAGDLEVTVECNPSSLTAEGARALAQQGVNRLSVGVQSLDDDALRFLGRLHDGRGALAAVNAALSSGARVSADVMFALPHQHERAFYAQLETLLALGLSHLSAYALTIEPGTPFGGQARKGLLKPASEDRYAELFTGIRERMARRDLEHYEVSNYARPGQESRHNQHTWRGGAYLGLGAAAVGCLPAPAGARRYRNHPDPARYSARADGPEVEVYEESLDGGALIREALMLGLRTQQGVDLQALARRVGRDPLRDRSAPLARRLAAGDVVREGSWLKVPPARWLVLDSIVADLF